MISWAPLCGLIGISAAQRNGFSVVAGILSGLLLGPLAVLIFWVSRVTCSDQRRRCLYCLEWIKANPTVCKHRHCDLPQLRPQVRVEASSSRRTAALSHVVNNRA